MSCEFSPVNLFLFKKELNFDVFKRYREDAYKDSRDNFQRVLKSNFGKETYEIHERYFQDFLNFKQTRDQGNTSPFQQ